jgi:hypothetical protein
MAKINGTSRKDILIGTRNNDEISALAGDDRIIASAGNDAIDGGEDFDTVDYRSLNQDVKFSINARLFDNGFFKSVDVATKNSLPGEPSTASSDRLNNVERIIGNANRVNTIDINAENFQGSINTVDVDLSMGKAVVGNSLMGQKVYQFENFDNYSRSGFDNGNYRITGNDRNNKVNFNTLSSSTNTTVIASKGDDTFTDANNNNSNAVNAIDYTSLNAPITLLPNVNFVISPRDGVRTFGIGKINKGGLGTDTYTTFNRFIGSANAVNTIDASSDGVAQLDIDLSNNIIKSLDPMFNRPLTVENFANVIGSTGNDKIIGGNNGGNLNGAGGNDNITGGTGDDTIAGTSGNPSVVPEVDTLTGGGGVNTFILGGSNGAYYLNAEDRDYALITNFDLFKDTIDLGNTSSYDLDPISSSEINLFTANSNGTRDLVARIQLSPESQASLGTAAKSARSVDGLTTAASAPIVPPIKILSTGGDTPVVV